MSKLKRSGVAWAARMRPPVKMKHRNQPRGGARNTQDDIFEDWDMTDPDYDLFSMEF